MLINGSSSVADERPFSMPALTDDGSNGGVVFIRPPVSSASLDPCAPSASTDRQPRRPVGSGRGPPRGAVGDCRGGRMPSFDAASCVSADSLDKELALADGASQAPTSRLPYPGRNERRTVLLSNLSDRATHKDVVGAVRGGALLDIYLRSYDRTASVSFVEGSAAQAFLNHTKRNDIYILGKRV